MDSNHPFHSSYLHLADYNDADHQAEFERYQARNEAIEAMLDGTVGADYVLDLLDEQDIDPDIYVQSVEEAVRYCLEHPHLDLEIVYQ